MYTIKEAAARTGVPIALLRAWERRYHVVAPTRTPAGYRLYDEAALDRLRSMRALVDDGWQPSAAAAAILDGSAPALPIPGPASANEAESPARATGSVSASAPGPAPSLAAALAESFVAAASDLDTSRLERVLDEMFAVGSFEPVADRVVLPALAAVGDAWAAGLVSVAGEHAASQAVLRRFAAAFQAAGRQLPTEGAALVGLPPGSHHEIGALAFAIAARRAGLPVVYLGPDLPAADWVATAVRLRAHAAVIGCPTAADVGPAVEVATTLVADRPELVAERPELVVAFGGRAGETAARRMGASAAGRASANPSRPASPPLVLPKSLTDAVDALASALGPGRQVQSPPRT
jgi:methanogenic corrinoid protein MtbC1